MKYLVTILFALSYAISMPVIANQDEYDDCILANLKGAKLDLVTHWIKQACDENYLSRNFKSKKRIAYNDCLLENLVGIESMRAAMEIRSACQRKHQ
jgi:hypothetical protein